MSDNQSDVILKVEDGIHILYMNTKENRFNPDFMAKIHAALDQVEAYKGKTALITTSMHKKLYSNGMDLNWMMENGEKSYEMVKDFVKLLARLYIFPVPTIAAINGHAFAGGFMWAMAHDFRYMQKHKGLVCLPEIDLQMPLPPSMTAVIKSKLDPQVYGEMIYGGRYTPEEAEQMKIVHAAIAKEDLMTVVMLKAKQLAKKDVNRKNLQKIKYIAYKDVYDWCCAPIEELQVELPKKFGWAKL